jgi:hypothetical protein
MRQFLKKYNIWVSVLASLLAVLLAIFFVIAPLKKDIQANSDDIQKKIIDESLDKARIAKIPEMEKMEDIFSENRGKLKIALSEDQEVDFIKKMEYLADETGNKVVLKIDDDQKDKPVAAVKKDAKNAGTEDIKSNLAYDKFLSIQVNLEGGYAEALNFIHKLENMNYYVDIVSLNMVKGDPTEIEAESNGAKSNEIFTGSSQTPPKEDKKILKTSLEIIVYLE